MKLHLKSALEIIELIKSKKISSEEVFRYFSERSNKYNEKLNVYVTLVDMQKERYSSPLFGLPIAVKDNFCTEDVRTTASANVLADYIPPYESTVTRRLKKAGAALLGKTNMDAWAHGSSTETSDFGPTKNPWDTSRAPGGSSGGSTAAVSAGLAPIALGTETAGSIRQPAAWSGVVGLKPTYGRVSRFGVIAMGSSFDCPGPISTTVEDSAFLLGLIAGRDNNDATTSPQDVPDYMELMKKKRKFTFGIPKQYLVGLEKSLEKRFWEAVDIYKELGHEVKEVELLDPEYSISVYTILQRSEVSSNLARYDGIRYGNDRSFFGKEAERRIMFGTYTLSHGYYDAFYKKAQKVKTLIIQDLERVFKAVDLIIAPTTPVTALKLGEFEKYPFFGEVMDKLNEAAAVAGTPAINIPVGLDKNDLPVGLQIMGDYFSEGDILDAAYQFEKETDFFGVIRKGKEKYR